MNHGHQFDMALSAERKAEQERKQAEREARKKLEAAAPDLLAACRKTLSTLTDQREIEYFRTEINILRTAIAKAKP